MLLMNAINFFDNMDGLAVGTIAIAMGFFTVIAVVLALISLLFMMPVLTEYFVTGLVPRFPTLIVCGFVMIAALMLFVAGVILSSLLGKDKRDFEFRLQEAERWKQDAMQH